ncbi:MAG: nitronate monooxygenase [Candidatus Lokiarchaeota archaeon]|nr:nitronate monooxygenase [Candidatus Lokiarchaeota archaeon]
MIWNTRITKVTGIQYPIIMGAFVGLGRAEFAASFSNAGGLGILTAINFKTVDKFQEEIEKMKKLTDKPYGVNFSVMPPQIIERTGRGRTEDSYLDYVDIAIDAGIKVCTTSAYKATKIGKKLHDAGCYWFHKCATMKHALSAKKAGADAVTIVGLEGTGFKNPLQNTTLINMTMARKLLKIPVIAAGGIGDARGFLAALAMGADAVCFGTAIIPTRESPASDSWKKALLNQDIFDDKFHKKIFHFQLRDSPIGSMAAGHCDEIVSLKEFINNIILNAEKILKKWGYQGNEFNTY